MIIKGYRKEELRKEYGYGKYQDKGLVTNKELKLGIQPYVRKNDTTTVEINEYLTALRRGVGVYKKVILMNLKKYNV